MIISINRSQFFNWELLKQVLCLVYCLTVRPRSIIFESSDIIVSIVTSLQTGGATDELSVIGAIPLCCINIIVY